MPAERLQKLLARAGHGSRRSAERLIAAGRVTVNDRVATLGQRADPEADRIAVDGHALATPPPPVTMMLNKPAGYIVTAADERGRQTVFDLLAEMRPDLRYVGRLDRETSGLLLLTTDGQLAFRLTHPRYRVMKTYVATVAEAPSMNVLDQLRTGVELDDGATAPAEVRLLDTAEGRTRLRIAIHEGRKRQVRRMLATVGHRVLALTRTGFGPLELGELERGASRRLSTVEEGALRRCVNLADGPRASVDMVARPLARRHLISAVSSHSLARSVAIDGPTASGKSVVGRAVAERLGFGFFDTGMMYRSCTLAVLERAIDPDHVEAVVELVQGLDLDMRWPDAVEPRAFLDGTDVTDRLREPQVERTVSLVSRIPRVRDELVRRQRSLAVRGPVVMVGRDIGTRVLTEARTKVFLDASIEVRARRRLGEELDTGRDSTFEGVLDDTRRRDELDATGHRAIRREQAAPDALVIDTDLLGIDQVVRACVDAYRAANAAT